MMITTALAHISIPSQNYHFFLMVGTFKMDFLSYFQVYQFGSVQFSCSVVWVPCCSSDLQNLKLELWEERLRKKGILWLIRIVIWQKPTQNCKAIFYQLKKKTGNLYSLTNFAVAVQSLSCVWLFATLWTAVCQASLMSIESVMLSNHLILLTNLLSVEHQTGCSVIF